MIDGLKITRLISDLPKWQNTTGIDLYTNVNEITGEIKQSRIRRFEDGSQTFKRWGKFEPSYFIEVIEKNKDDKSTYRLNVRGSIHKGAHGNNHSRLTWDEMQSQIEYLASSLNSDPTAFTIQNLEFGLNIEMPQPVKPFLDSVLIGYMGKPFNKFDDDYTGKSIGYYCQCSEYTIKIYDKTLQNNLKDGRNICRIEKFANKMRCIKTHGLKTLEDLTDKDKVFSLLDNLNDSWNRIIMIDHAILLKATNPRDKSNLCKYINPRFWLMLKLEVDKYRYHVENLRELQLKYFDTLHQDIKRSMNDECKICFNITDKKPAFSPIVIPISLNTKTRILPIKINGDLRGLTPRSKKIRVNKTRIKEACVLNGKYFNFNHHLPDRLAIARQPAK